MADFVEVPPQRLPAQVLRALLEEYASRDGTDYGERERSLDEKVEALQRQLESGDVALLYDAESETWDLLERRDAQRLLEEE